MAALATVIPIRTPIAPATIRLDVGPPQPSLRSIAGIVCMQASQPLWEVLGARRISRFEVARGTIAWLAASFGHSPEQIGDYLGRDPGETAVLIALRDRVIQASPEIADRMIGLVALVEAACP